MRWPARRRASVVRVRERGEVEKGEDLVEGPLRAVAPRRQVAGPRELPEMAGEPRAPSHDPAVRRTRPGPGGVVPNGLVDRRDQPDPALVVVLAAPGPAPVDEQAADLVVDRPDGRDLARGDGRQVDERLRAREGVPVAVASRGHVTCPFAPPRRLRADVECIVAGRLRLEHRSLPVRLPRTEPDQSRTSTRMPRSRVRWATALSSGNPFPCRLSRRTRPGATGNGPQCHVPIARLQIA